MKDILRPTPFRIRAAVRSLGLTAALGLAACTPAARPLAGTPTQQALPATSVPPGNRQMAFNWKYKDDTFEAQGEGVVRVAGPNRARLDFFLKNGMGGGMAILDGDSLIIPGIELVRRFLPPVPMLWATLGRFSVPATADTIVRLDGDTLRADLGALKGQDASRSNASAWRVGFVGRALVQVERIDKGKLHEWVRRSVNDAAGTGELHYMNESGRRNLSISVTETKNVEAFDDAIWRRP